MLGRFVKRPNSSELARHDEAGLPMFPVSASGWISAGWEGEALVIRDTRPAPVWGTITGQADGTNRYAFTQLEASEARKFFPCFDEPALKARFRISVSTGARNAVVSNAPPLRSRSLPGGRKRVDFAETPRLSSYLVAIAVGELERSRPVRVGKTAIRVWHVPGKRHQPARRLVAHESEVVGEPARQPAQTPWLAGASRGRQHDPFQALLLKPERLARPLRLDLAPEAV